MSVPNMRSKVIDKLQFITVDGIKYDLHNPPKRSVVSVEGFGLPEQIINSTSGPYQHGESVLSYRLSPRRVDATIRHNACSPSKYWTYRDTLVDTLGLQRTDPNNPVEGVLRRIFYVDGVKKVRDLKVFLTEGLKFTAPPNDRWDQWGINEQLTFTAHNPILFDPTQITNTITGYGGEGTPPDMFTHTLIFPFTFPFVLGNLTGSTTINYAGSWYEYPTIEIIGPTEDVTIYNETTGKYIRYLGPVNNGETVTINLSYGAKTVTGQYGEDLIGNIQSSDLGTFSLHPDPIVANGTNVIRVYILNRSDTPGDLTTINIKYYNRYIGI
jgi:hypothetical protein